jgi:nitrous oxidase accessory protein NosD
MGLVPRTVFALAVAVAMVGVHRPCHARRVLLVAPGPGTPLQDAIDAAAEGDRILLAPGTYAEAIVVDKPLRLWASDGAVVDAGCSAPVTISVTSDHVDLRGLEVRGARFVAIDIEQRDHVKVRSCVVTETCATGKRGINLVQSTNVTLYRDRVSGFGEAGFYFGAISERNAVKVKKTEAHQNAEGFVIENTLPGPRAVIMTFNVASLNTVRGIVLRGSNAVKLSYNVVTGDPAVPTQVGIELDAQSNDNLLRYNSSHGNVTDVIDDGSGNCWEDISHDTGTVVETVCR